MVIRLESLFIQLKKNWSQRQLLSIFLSKSVIFIKMLSSLIAVFACAAIGREGPSLQISAAIAIQVGLFFKAKNPYKNGSAPNYWCSKWISSGI